jgi:uncharacterized protein
VPHVSLTAHILVAFAAMGAGVLNALAGGGTLITFSLLSAVGVPPVLANATNTVALCVGPLGGAYAQRRDFETARRTWVAPLVVAATGGLAGGLLLVATSEDAFRRVIPLLILGACALLASQERLRARIVARQAAGRHRVRAMRAAELAAVFATGIYGGYFGAGIGIILIAVMGLMSDLPFAHLNAMKQVQGFTVNAAAALFFIVSGHVMWSLALTMGPACLVGGSIGGRIVGRLDPRPLRRFIVVVGCALAVIYAVK